MTNHYLAERRDLARSVPPPQADPTASLPTSPTGPHVGVGSAGFGTIDRLGRSKPGACCGSACAALAHCRQQLLAKPGQAAPTKPAEVNFLDAQQGWVCSALGEGGGGGGGAGGPASEASRGFFAPQARKILGFLPF